MKILFFKQNLTKGLGDVQVKRPGPEKLPKSLGWFSASVMWKFNQ